MKTVVSLLFLAFAVVPAAHADYYMKAKGMGGMDTETWTQGKKQRAQAAVPQFGSYIQITRLDKGVEWTVDPGRKIYQERPIALPYTPATAEEETISGEEAAEARAMMGGAQAGDDCVPLIRRVPGDRMFAGHKAEGYRTECEGRGVENGSMTMWIAPSKGSLARVAKESEAFEKERAKAMYANWPAKERAELEAGTKLLRDAFKGALGSMKGVKVPDGVPLAMELPTDAEGGGGMFFEVSEISTAAVDPRIFDLPGDYTKVDDLAKVQADAMMREMGMDPDEMSRMMEEMQRSAQDMAADEE